MLSEALGKIKRGTKYELTFPTLPSLNYRPQKITLHQNQYEHDVLIAEYKTVNLQKFDLLKTGVPVSFKVTQGINVSFWQGYVAFSSKEEGSQRNRTLSVHCVSSSYVLKERATRVFKNKSIPDVVKNIAKQFGFKYVGDPHPRIFEQLAMSGHSYWEWIQEQAKRIGYGLVIKDMTIYFQTIEHLLDAKGTVVPIFRMNNYYNTYNTQYLDRTLKYFKVLKGDYVEDQEVLKTIKQVGGVDPITNKSFASTFDPNGTGTIRKGVPGTLFNEFEVGEVAKSRVVSSQAAKGHATMASLDIPAELRGQGDPRIRPHYPIYVSNTGELTDGFWVVTNVVHTYHITGEYDIDAKVATDGVGGNEPSPFRSSDGRTIGTVNLAHMLSSSAEVVGPSNSVVTATSVYPRIAESAQGFNQNKTTWGVSPSGVLK